ncbi:CWF19-like protein 2 [Acanthaster planci]|uniref:CWF19-like protein 2 n=1 Tax=Acanthaster planci TaxID=133434 RepID=A0A8B7Z042_ACAPL|nr:CWF19-like protein 2 [Acanthaster planci]
MATSIAFESQTKRRRERDEKRRAQALILQKVKEEYENKERQKEARKLRGDDKWMLSSVSDRIQAEGEQLKSKKRKKDKKKKKEKKAKHKCRHEASDSDFSSKEDETSDEMEWVENDSASSKPLVQNITTSNDKQRMQRDNWMNDPFTVATYSRDDIRREKVAQQDSAETEKEKEQKMLLDNPGQSDRELNPFWKDGGTGLPEEKHDISAPKLGIADAGVGWLKKQYQRIMERAKEEGRSVEELAAERWGSLEKYYELLARAEGAQNRPSQKDSNKPRQHRDMDRGTSYRRDWEEKTHRDRERGDDRCRGRDHGRDSKRDCDRKSDRYRDRLIASTQKGSRSPDRSSDRSRDKYGGRESKSHSSVLRRSEDEKQASTYSRTSTRLSKADYSKRKDLKPDSVRTLGGLKGMFKKPGEELSDSKDDSRRRDTFSGSNRRQENEPPAWKKTFQKPNENLDKNSASSTSSMGESSSKSSYDVPAWKKQTTETNKQGKGSIKSSQSSEEESKSSSESSSSSGSESDSSVDTEREKNPSPPLRILSDAEMNQLGAKIVKAELMGNEDLAKKLKAQMEASHQAKVKQATKGPSQTRPSSGKMKTDIGSSDEEEVVLTRMDRTGQSWPLLGESSNSPPNKGKKRKKKQNIVTHGKDGQRERYFGDDDQQELRDMVRKERMTSSEDQLRLFNKVANKALKKVTDDHTLDDMFVSAAAHKRSSSQEEERHKAAAVSQHHKMAASMSICPFCLDSPEMQKHLIIALGIKVYLCLPASQSLTDGHCLIVPMQHTVASTALDEDVWNEVQIYRKGLTKMFEDQERDAVFLETCMNPRGYRHMVMECVPLPKDIGDMAPIYFKKAIQESESEWSQNKKLVDTRKKDIRKSIPRGFPYFSVDFGLDGGFAHVIEDDKVFPHYFGKEIIGGMLDLEPQLWRRPHRQNFDDQRQKVLQFGEWWKPFDWTQKIGKD